MNICEDAPAALPGRELQEAGSVLTFKWVTFCHAIGCRHIPVLKSLYLRLLANGKAKKLALTVLMRKLIILANLLLKNPNFTVAS